MAQRQEKNRKEIADKAELEKDGDGERAELEKQEAKDGSNKKKASASSRLLNM